MKARNYNVDGQIFLQNALKSRIKLSKGSMEVTLRIQVNTTKHTWVDKHLVAKIWYFLGSLAPSLMPNVFIVWLQAELTKAVYTMESATKAISVDMIV